MQYVRHTKGDDLTNQRRLSEESPLKRATFWMQEDTLAWLRRYAKVSGITQGALLNCLILRYQLDMLDETADPAKVERIRRYVELMLGKAPKIVPNPAYRITQSAAFRQSIKK